ncbi:RNA polymerase sigma factor [Salidesulfovibrio brasiliensis]|uniref:RNA polymerase sigma factor n=1 Tax=Salidesulfovibrio brasiliensis TaxID=221711 RepID=UPI000A71A761|nr:sigma-70 family RNA polymerase sigma factor [Salidesulfovibrio brasiliensis]
MKKDSDSEIIKKVLSGRPNAYSTIVERYQEHVGRIVGGHVPHGFVEEVVQNVFVNAFRSLAGFRAEKPFAHWLSRISIRCCHDFWRREYRRRETPVSALGNVSRDLLDQLMAQQSQDTYLAQRQRREAGEVLDWALGHLSASDRMIITLTALEEKSAAETADLLGISKVNVKVRAFRARKKLKSILEQAI